MNDWWRWGCSSVGPRLPGKHMACRKTGVGGVQGRDPSSQEVKAGEAGV